MKICIWDPMGHTSYSNLYCYFGGHDSLPYAQRFRTLSQCTRLSAGPLIRPPRSYCCHDCGPPVFQALYINILVSSFIFFWQTTFISHTSLSFYPKITILVLL